MLAIHWSPPFDNGGYPIERYIIEKREAERSHWTQAGVCPPDVTAYCITDLAENQMYYFRVLAETAYGFSEPLEMEKPVIPRRIFGKYWLDIRNIFKFAYSQSLTILFPHDDDNQHDGNKKMASSSSLGHTNFSP